MIGFLIHNEAIFVLESYSNSYASTILSEPNLHNSDMKIKFGNTLAFALNVLDFY